MNAFERINRRALLWDLVEHIAMGPLALHRSDIDYESLSMHLNLMQFRPSKDPFTSYGLFTTSNPIDKDLPPLPVLRKLSWNRNLDRDRSSISFVTSPDLRTSFHELTRGDCEELQEGIEQLVFAIRGITQEEPILDLTSIYQVNADEAPEKEVDHGPSYRRRCWVLADRFVLDLSFDSTGLFELGPAWDQVWTTLNRISDRKPEMTGLVEYLDYPTDRFAEFLASVSRTEPERPGQAP